MQTSIVRGSLSDIAQQSGKDIAESFVNVDAVVLVDTSASMQRDDAPNGQSRYDAACCQLEALQRKLPGKIAVLSFSSHTEFCPSGLPTYLGDLTDVAGALRFAKLADVPEMQFFLISDGEPDDEHEALAVAATFENKINTIYVGPESGFMGIEFLERLANSTGGQHKISELTRALGSTVERLMLTGGK